MIDIYSEIKNAHEVLKNGGIILYPTDTIWGIGCDATNSEAVKRIFLLKKRSAEKNLILLLDTASRIPSYVNEVHETAWSLIEFSNKPLTIIYDGARNLPPEVIGDDGSIAIRITKDEFCNKLISKLKKPLVSTSANISGEDWPKCYDDISEEIKNGVDYIVQWRQAEKSQFQPSTILHLKSNGQIKFIRP
jgi:L-threonylcarbamoyladenylate synthase